MYKRIFLLFSLLCFCLLHGCSSGVYVKLDSTSPDFGPILIGMKRSEAEMYLGMPLFSESAGDMRYRSIYEYETEPTGLDTVSTDVLDIVTLGLGNLIIGPVDRFKGGSHLISILYEIKDEHSSNDMVIDIYNRLKIKIASK